MTPLNRSGSPLVLLIAAAVAVASAACATTTPAAGSVSGADSRAERRDRSARVDARVTLR